MALYETTRPAPFGAVTTFRIVTLIEKPIAAFKVWNDLRKTRNDLLRLSNRELADIGMLRSDIDHLRLR